MSKKLLAVSFLAVACLLVVVYVFIVKKPLDPSKSKPAQSAESLAESASVRKPASVPTPPDEGAAKQSIGEIRRELQAIMQLNERINQVQTTKSEQLLKIQEQAVIHQKILATIEQLSETQAKAIPSREALLTQEKLRVIREEALRNKKDLEKIQLSSQTS